MREERRNKRIDKPTTKWAGSSKVKRFALNGEWQEFEIPEGVNRGYFSNTGQTSIEISMDGREDGYLTLLATRMTHPIPLRSGEKIKAKTQGVGALECITWSE